MTIRRVLLVSSLSLVVGIAAYLRVPATSFGLPLFVHPDEKFVVEYSLRIAGTGDLHPRVFAYPSGLIYVEAAVAALTGGSARTADGSVEDSPALRRRMRLVTVAFALATILAVFAAGRVLFGDLGGLAAAALVAINPLHITNSLPVTTDVPAGFGIAMATWASALVLRNGRTRDYLFAGAMVGLASGMKYTAVLAASMVVVAHLGRTGWNPIRLFDRRLVAAGLVSVVVFLATTPYAALDFPQFRYWLTRHDTVLSGSLPGADSPGSNSYDRYSKWLVEVLGPLGTAIAMAGLLTVAWGSGVADVLLIVIFPLTYVAFVGSFKVGWERYLVLVMPALALAAAASVNVPRLFRDRRLRIATGVTVAVLLAACVHAQAPAAWMNARVPLLPDTRGLAEEWIQANLPEGALVAREFYTPPVAGSKFRVQNLSTFGLLSEPDPGRYDFLITSSGDYNRFVNHRDRYAEAAQRYDEIFARYPEVKRFEPGFASGPTIRILATPHGQSLLAPKPGVSP